MRRSTRLIVPCLLLSILLLSSAYATASECPIALDSKLLALVEVLDGPIGTGQPQAPDRNRWLITPIPRNLWNRYPPYYLICKYQETSETVSVELPRNTRVCEPTKGVNVRCR